MGHHLGDTYSRACRSGDRAEPPAGSRFTTALALTLLTALSTGTTLFGSTAEAAAPYRFDATGYLGDASLMPDWADTMVRERSQALSLDACLADISTCPRYYRGLRHLLQKAEALPAKRQISLISHYVNRKRYTWDRSEKLDTSLSDGPVNYRSRWATVEEFMRRGGDCEDYATTKYYLLRRLGFEANQLRVVVTWDRGARGYHAVLAVRHENQVLLLESDNTIRRGSRHRYKFIYSINEESIWDHEVEATSASRQQTAATQHEETPA